MNVDIGDDWKKDYTNHVSGRDYYTEDESNCIRDLKDGGYNHMMREVKSIRDKTFEVFYDMCDKELKMSKHEVNEMLINMGIDDYNNHVKPEKKCSSVQDVVDDMSVAMDLSFSDVINALQDRGMLTYVIKKFNVSSAPEFLRSRGINVDDL